MSAVADKPAIVPAPEHTKQRIDGTQAPTRRLAVGWQSPHHPEAPGLPVTWRWWPQGRAAGPCPGQVGYGL